MTQGDEYNYCGRCRRQQSADVEKCIQCGKQTVTWRPDRESEDTAIKRWKTVNGEPV